VLTAISRYGARVVPQRDAIVEECVRRGELVQGPAVTAFEEAFARRLGGGTARAASYGRMAFFHILKALDLSRGSEIVFPALTFWVVPEMARVAGLTPVFADVDPTTFNLDPAAFERAITPCTRAVVPTHIYGLPCDMDEIVTIARRHRLLVVEDCAHALGALYHGRPVGTLGDASFFSFQLLKPLNTGGGGMAFTHDAALGRQLDAVTAAEPWPEEARVRARLRLTWLEQALIAPRVFTLTVFPLLWTSRWLGLSPDVYLWEKVRRLEPLPPAYAERYSNVQAAIGVAGLERLDGWNSRAIEHARFMTAALRGLDGVGLPPAPSDRTHIYYQYCVYVPDRPRLVRSCLRAGVDLEYHHMDVCPELELFRDHAIDAPGARRTRDAVQIPIHAGLTAPQLEAVARRARGALERDERRSRRASHVTAH
jgi:dTDP-4-amino-4,6-dideoxygalactose transaminase